MENFIPPRLSDTSARAEVTIPALVEWYASVNRGEPADQTPANAAGIGEQRDIARSEADTASSQELGMNILSAPLRTQDPHRSLTVQLFHHKEKGCYNLVLVRALRSRLGIPRKTVEALDLEKVVVLPVYAEQSTQIETSYSRIIDLTREPNASSTFSLTFSYLRDMFAFQQVLTGYTVVHDCPRVLTTCEEWRLFSNKQIHDLCRLELWTPWELKENPAPLGMTTAASRHTLFAPLLQPLLATSPTGEVRRASFDGAARSTAGGLDVGAGAGEQAPAGGKALGSPCLVFLAQRIPRASVRDLERLTRSFLVIEITPYLMLDIERQPVNTCVLKGKPGLGSSYLPARRSIESAEASPWNLASLSQERREPETTPVKKLKSVVIRCSDWAERENFRIKFLEVQRALSKAD